MPQDLRSRASRSSRAFLVAGMMACGIGAGVLPAPSRSLPPSTGSSPAVASILVYHRFGPVVRDEMTVRTATFRAQLQYLRSHHCTIVPLARVMAFLEHEAPAPPARAVVITVDDGHESVFTELAPVIRELEVPVTLFIYPSAISNASYALTWDQLATLRRTGLVDIQSHTYWHPNFTHEKGRLSPSDYRAFVLGQLTRSRDTLARRLDVRVDLLAWPFGIYDPELIELARSAGYRGGFTLDRRCVRADDDLLALPRFLVTDGIGDRGFAAMLPPEVP